MASAIKSIPTLKTEAAQRFSDNMKTATAKRSTIDFSKQVKTTRSILKKANLK